MEKEIAHIALNNLRQNTSITGNFTERTGVLDGILDLVIEGRDVNFIAEIKNEVRRHQLPKLESYHQEYKNVIIIAEHIFPKIKEELRNMGVAYLEANGNFFVKQEGVYILIDTNTKTTFKKELANRAFTKTGLKVLFHFLNDKNLINKTQREIADKAGVGLGNIPQVINGLKETGYVIQYTKQQLVWENRKELLDRWINAYATELRPKLVKGKYTLKKNWEDILLNTENTLWGGEPAADLLTNYLRPEHYILYTKEKQSELMKNYHIIPKLEGEVEVLELFWEPRNEKTPPILIYAELMLTGGKRNKETAEKIYNDYIQPIL
ncbi:MAG: hypothetical protein ACI93P_002773 [bacterium]|jgi:hypothetical protein